LKLRYRVKVKGLEDLNQETLNKPGGILFLPNHPAILVDPAIVTISIWKKFVIRPIAIDYVYDTPVVNKLMLMLNALRVPNFDLSCNSLKVKKLEEEFNEIINGLKVNDNFLIYPAGQLKNSNKEVVGGHSGVYRVLKANPNVNVVLVRVKGLYGSIFSRYYEGKTPDVMPALWWCFKEVIKNFIFFTPKRDVTVEFQLAPDDLPIENSSRLEFNRYLENWYNQPDGLTKQEGEQPGDSTVLISYSIWGDKFPPQKKTEILEEHFDISEIPIDIQKKVIEKLSLMTGQPTSAFHADMHITNEVGLDSLDLSELGVFLMEEFKIEHIPATKLTTVGKIMGVAAGLIKYTPPVVDTNIDLRKWKAERPREIAKLGEGDTIPEVFLDICDKYSKYASCGDLATGIMTYKEYKLRAILIADYIKSLPGEYVGIFLPASLGAFLCIIACELAGKIPLTINWTVGPRHLESVVKSSKVKAILSSWKFLDRLDNVDLSPIQDKLIMLEDVRKNISLKDKLKALYRSKMSNQSILNVLGSDKVKPEDTALLLFTSGTESDPKGVPLSHRNILKNLESGISASDLFTDDVLYNILPPFHSFGANVCGLAPILSGVRVAFYPDPNDGINLAKGIEIWGVTFFCGAPAFLIKMLKAAKTEQLDTLRFIVSGAESAPPSLLNLLESHGKLDKFLEGYGITECSPILSANRLGEERVGVGPAVPGVDLMIADQETFTPLKTGERGMILAAGENIFSGYLNPDIKPPFIEIDGVTWYKTGDLGRLDEAGNLIIDGRLKRFVKIAGEMISLPAIEAALNDWASEKDWKATIKNEEEEYDGPLTAVSAKEFDDEKTEIYLFSMINTDTKEINTYLRSSGFSNLTKISKVFTIQNIPLLGSGKINYRLLENTYLNPLKKNN
ncbi:MAG: AMP-binding protein, partial [Chlamydiota bacterium]